MASHTISIAGSDLRWIVWIIICLTCILISDRNVKGCPTRTIRLRVHLQTWKRTSIIIAVCPYKTECDLSADTLRICSIGWFKVYYAAPQAAYYAIPNEEVFRGVSLPACKMAHRDTLTLLQPAKWPIRLICGALSKEAFSPIKGVPNFRRLGRNGRKSAYWEPIDA